MASFLCGIILKILRLRWRSAQNDIRKSVIDSLTTLAFCLLLRGIYVPGIPILRKQSGGSRPFASAHNDRGKSIKDS